MAALAGGRRSNQGPPPLRTRQLITGGAGRRRDRRPTAHRPPQRPAVSESGRSRLQRGSRRRHAEQFIAGFYAACGPDMSSEECAAPLPTDVASREHLVEFLIARLRELRAPQVVIRIILRWLTTVRHLRTRTRRTLVGEALTSAATVAMLISSIPSAVGRRPGTCRACGRRARAVGGYRRTATRPVFGRGLIRSAHRSELTASSYAG